MLGIQIDTSISRSKEVAFNCSDKNPDMNLESNSNCNTSHRSTPCDAMHAAIIGYKMKK